jgi:hypothetical protein
LKSTHRFFKSEAPVRSGRWGLFLFLDKLRELKQSAPELEERSYVSRVATTSSALHFINVASCWLVVLVWRCDRRFGEILDALSPLATVRWAIPKYPSKSGEIRNQIRSVGDGLLIIACREVQVEHLSAAIDVEIVVHRLSISLGREKPPL